MLTDVGYQPVVFARLTGLPLQTLRNFERRGLLCADLRDERTGALWYSPHQLPPGRLLGALVRTGMSPRRAAQVVADGDRAAVLEHLADARRLLRQAEEHLPPRGGVARVWVEGAVAWSVDIDGVRSASELLDAARAARRALSEHLGCSTGELPRWTSDAPVPTGPAVDLDYGDGNWLELPSRLLLPLPEGVPPPPGRAEHVPAAWCLVGADVDLEVALDVDHEDTLVGERGVVPEVLRTAFRRGLGMTRYGRLVLSEDLGRAAPLVSLL